MVEHDLENIGSAVSKGSLSFQIWMHFWKISKGGGVSFSIKPIVDFFCIRMGVISNLKMFVANVFAFE